MNILLVVFQLVIMLGGFLIYNYIKQVPEQIHAKSLETFRTELQKEIVRLEASESNLHLKKIEKFTEFTEILQQTLNAIKYDEEDRKNLEDKTTKAMESFSKDIIFFASEKTLDKFVEYRRYSKIVQSGGKKENIKFQLIMAELILEMRRDLGFNNDGITVDHYMYILVNDWDEHRDEYHELAKNAQHLNNI